MASTAAAGVTRAQLAELGRVIRTTPIIDNHAHPLLKPEMLSRHPLMSIATEAHGDAIAAAYTRLAHHRANKQHTKEHNSSATRKTKNATNVQRRIEAPDDWISLCLHGIDSILLD